MGGNYSTICKPVSHGDPTRCISAWTPIYRQEPVFGPNSKHRTNVHRIVGKSDDMLYVPEILLDLENFLVNKTKTGYATKDLFLKGPSFADERLQKIAQLMDVGYHMRHIEKTFGVQRPDPLLTAKLIQKWFVDRSCPKNYSMEPQPILKYITAKHIKSISATEGKGGDEMRKTLQECFAEQIEKDKKDYDIFLWLLDVAWKRREALESKSFLDQSDKQELQALYSMLGHWALSPNVFSELEPEEEDKQIGLFFQRCLEERMNKKLSNGPLIHTLDTSINEPGNTPPPLPSSVTPPPLPKNFYESIKTNSRSRSSPLPGQTKEK